MPNRQQQMRFLTIIPATPTTTTSIELIDSSQGKRGSNSDSIAQLTTSQSASKLTFAVAGADNKDNQQQQQCPPASLQTNENHHSSPSSPPHLNGVKNIASQQQPDNNMSTNNVSGDVNQQKITTIDPDRERRTAEIYSGASDGIQPQPRPDGNV